MRNVGETNVPKPTVPLPRPMSRFLSVVAVTLSAFAAMTLYEFVKTLLFPSATTWESHIATIAVTTTVVAIAAFFVLRKLDRTEGSYRMLVELSPDALLVQRHGKIIFANRAYAAMLGAPSVDELLGRHPIDFVYPDDREIVKERMQKLYNLEPLTRGENRMLRFDGEAVTVEVVGRPVNFQGAPATLILFRDIGERRQAEQELRRSEANLAAAQQIAHIGSFEFDLNYAGDPNETPLRWSDEAFRIYGYEPGGIEVTRATFLRALHPMDRDRIRQSVAEAMRERKSFGYDYRIIRPDGTERVAHGEFNIVCDEKTGAPIRAVGTVQDITERKEAENRFYKAFHLSPEPTVIVTKKEGRYIDVNESFLRITGHRREETIGRTSMELKMFKNPEDRFRLIDQMKETGYFRDVEANFYTKSGELRVGLHSADYLEIGGQKCIIAVLKDITERKLLEQRLRQAQKMEAIGQFSGGIAHDFNNMLGVIIGYCEILEERLPQGDPLRKECGQIKKAGQSAASLTRQLLAFSRQQMLELRVLSLNTVAADTEKMLRRLIGENIELITKLSPGLGQIKADEGQIQQVILNLAVNARDAMPDGGKLVIETRNTELDEGYAVRHPPTVPGSYVLLTMTDTGHGIDAQTQAHIFEPFFTTKEIGKGTGLGLATVYGVIKQSGGYIWVYSEPGLGSTFKIYLPRVAEAAQRNQPAHFADGALRGSKTILVVEDEEPLRTLTRMLLEESGYTVLEANGGSQATEIASRHLGPIHLLLTDMVMPGINGRAIAQKLMPMHPEMAVIYMSGYMGFTARGVLDSEANFLSKPVTRDDLLRKVHEVLSLQKETAAI